MSFSIYKVDNTVDDKLYIGSTTRTVAQRWEEHKSMALAGENKPLYIAINEYGPEKFTASLIEECPNLISMNNREYELILLHNTAQPNGYNVLTRRLSNEQVAIIKFDLYKWSVPQYARLFQVDESTVYLARSNQSGNPYRNVTKADIIDAQKYLANYNPEEEMRNDISFLESFNYESLNSKTASQIVMIIKKFQKNNPTV